MSMGRRSEDSYLEEKIAALEESFREENVLFEKEEGESQNEGVIDPEWLLDI